MLRLEAGGGSFDWMSQGACRAEDPELFFPIAATGPASRQIRAAKAVCGRCAVRAPCLAYALETRPDGIWGGTTTEERPPARAIPLAQPSAGSPPGYPGTPWPCGRP
jgi:WhiB family transcriptional regulator, redox-sensing transcriptional regulator